jgi:hypothetical protein
MHLQEHLRVFTRSQAANAINNKDNTSNTSKPSRTSKVKFSSQLAVVHVSSPKGNEDFDCDVDAGDAPPNVPDPVTRWMRSSPEPVSEQGSSVGGQSGQSVVHEQPDGSGHSGHCGQVDDDKDHEELDADQKDMDADYEGDLPETEFSKSLTRLPSDQAPPPLPPVPSLMIPPLPPLPPLPPPQDETHDADIPSSLKNEPPSYSSELPDNVSKSPDEILQDKRQQIQKLQAEVEQEQLAQEIPLDPNAELHEEDEPDEYDKEQAERDQEDLNQAKATFQFDYTNPSRVLWDLERWKFEYLTDPVWKKVYWALKEENTQDLAPEVLSKVILKGVFLVKEGRTVVPGRLIQPVLKAYHENKTYGHFGINKMKDLMRRYYFIPDLHEEVKKLIDECHTCQITKADNRAPAGQMHPLPIPVQRWTDISMDFLGHLPKTSRGHNEVWTIIDQATKMAHFIPVKNTMKAAEMERLFIDNIVRIHGTPSTIVSDRDTKIIADIWDQFVKLLNIRKKLTVAGRAQADGQAEVGNRAC